MNTKVTATNNTDLIANSPFEMFVVINNKYFNVKVTEKGRYYYWSVVAGGRWMPCKKADVMYKG